MRFSFSTDYDFAALTAMSKVLGKTIQSKRRIIVNIFGFLYIGLCLLLLFITDFSLHISTVVIYVVMLLVLLSIIFRNRYMAFWAKRGMIKGTEHAYVEFHDDGYNSKTEVGESHFQYGSILNVAETKDYFIFVLSKVHSQAYAKKSMQGGSEEDFRNFIEQRTGKKIIKIK